MCKVKTHHVFEIRQRRTRFKHQELLERDVMVALTMFFITRHKPFVPMLEKKCREEMDGVYLGRGEKSKSSVKKEVVPFYRQEIYKSQVEMDAVLFGKREKSDRPFQMEAVIFGRRKNAIVIVWIRIKSGLFSFLYIFII